jgi:hypothetical protein
MCQTAAFRPLLAVTAADALDPLPPVGLNDNSGSSSFGYPMVDFEH